MKEIQLSSEELSRAKNLEQRNVAKCEQYDKNAPLKYGIYQDLQGRNVLVLGITEHAETKEKFVVYVPVSSQLYTYQEKGFPLKLRALADFTERKDGHVPKYCWVGQET